jgi:hypothetical protein
MEKELGLRLWVEMVIITRKRYKDLNFEQE